MAGTAVASSPISFTGEYPQRIDAKGRVSIPAPLRRVLDAGDADRPDGTLPRFQLAYGNHIKGHLRLYTISYFDLIKAEIQRKQDGSEAMRNTAYLYLTQSAEIETDKDGRIVLPQRQREKLGLDEGEVTFMGFGTHCELWKADAFSTSNDSSVDDWLASHGPNFDPISLLGPLGSG